MQQQATLVSALIAVVAAQYGGGAGSGYQPQGNNGFGGRQQQQPQQGGFMPQQQQQWGNGGGMMGGGMDRGMGGGMGRDFEDRRPHGPPFLQNVTRQAMIEFHQIMENRNLTKAQIQTAVGNWSTTYNVADQVTAFNTQKQQRETQARQNTTTAVQQLPTTLNQIYSIMDNQNLTPSQEHQQIGQIFQNMTYPLNSLVGSAIQGGMGGHGGKGGKGGRDEDSGEMIIFGF